MQSKKLYVETPVGGEYPPLRNKTIFAASRCDLAMILGDASDEHPMSTRSASDGRRWKSCAWKYAASILMFLMLSVGNVWAIDNWQYYSCFPKNKGEYYLYAPKSNAKFFNKPVTAGTYTPCISADNADQEGETPAILFQVNIKSTTETAITLESIKFKSTSSSSYDKFVNITSTKANYVNSWGTSTDDGDWTLTLIKDHANFPENEINTSENKYYPAYYLKQVGANNQFLSPTARTYSSKTYAQLELKNSLTTANKKTGWVFITPEAYADATASNQYYYTVAAQAYTNGAASTDGGTVGIVPKTYQKPDVTDWAAGDYGTSIAKSKKGSNESSALVTFYSKINKASETYTFTGFTNGTGDALTASADIAANTYYEVDAVNHIYRVTIAVNGSEGGPTNFELHACFASAAEPVVNVYNTNDEVTGYGTLAAALDASANGYRVELLANIENVSSTIAINKDITLDFNGYSITGSATNLVTVSGDVTFVDNSLGTPGGVRTTGATAVLVTGGSLTINDGKYIAATYAVERTGGSVTIKNGGFESDGTQDINGTITLNGGFFYNNSGLNVTSDYAVSSDIPTGMKYTTADYRYMVVKKTSENYPVCVVISKNKKGDVVSRKNFNTLAKAIAYANNNVKDDLPKTLLLREDCTLPAGNYTIPIYTILSIPYSAEQTDAMPNISRINTETVPSSAYCTLTLASGVHIDVFGAIEVGGIMSTGNVEASGTSGISRPGGDTYGLMQMNAGSSMTIYEDANLYAWGFIQGKGTIDMRRGAVAREMFQMYDWKGFSPTANMAMDGSINYTLHVLPINQYYIQNIEVKTTYRPGSKLYGQVGAYVLGMSIGFNDIGIVGVKYSDAEKAADPDLEDDVAIFLMDNEDTSEDTWVCKYYDPSTDQQVFDVNNSAHLGSLVMKIDLAANGINIPNPLNPGHDIVDLDVDSRDFALPLTNNFKIHLLYGNLNVTQSTAMLPGSVIEVNKKGTLTIMDQVWKKVGGVFKWVTEPQTLYLYDKNQWGTYVFDHKNANYVMGYASRIRYRHGGVPTVRDISTAMGLGDAQLIVHGTVDVKGYLKTTKGDRTARPIVTNKILTGVTETEHATTDGGASIISTIEDAGTITYSRKPGYESYGSHTSYVWQVDAISSDGEPSYFGNRAIPAWLTNEVGYTETAGSKAGKSYCFIDFDGDGKGEWKCLTEDGCFVYDEHDVYYAKPQDYVALKNGKTEEADHTYQSADGSRTLILVDDCQWWEVEPVVGHPDLFHCTHPQNNVYYYFDYVSSKWLEKRYTVTWLDWDGTEFGDPYILKYGVQPKYLGNIPQREADAYYTYNFIGWSPAITESTIVTGDVTYTAQYERQDVMYSVTWKDLAGNIIETGYYKLGDVPSCTEDVDMTGKEWNPAVGAVTGNTIYQLQAKAEKAKYTITWKNWDGTTLQTTTPDAGTAAAKVLAGYTAATPTKPALDDIAFEFAGWTPTVVDANADAVYTATFTEHLITYAITWKNYDGTPLLVQEVTPNTVPQYSGVTPVHASEGYSFIGWTPAVVAATENAEYVAQFELQNKMVDGETYSIPSSTQQTLTTVTITDDGKLVIPATSTLTVNSLILEATSNASGQLDAPSNSNIVTVNAYFDLELNTDARHWHAFGVPWAVDINTNPLTEVETGRTLNISRDYEIMYYDGAERAANGPSAACWKYLRHYDEAGQPVEVLQPGRGYMIAFGSHVKTVRFVKKSGAPIIYTGSVGVTAHQIGAISNPMAYHTTMDAGVGVGQVHDGGEIGHDGYDPVTITAKRFVVGKTVYIDPQLTKSVVIEKADGTESPVAAPARRGAKAMNKKYLTLEDYYTVALTNANGEERKVYVLPEEDKEDMYVVGHDLTMMGMSDRKAQIWVNRYDVNLGLNTIAPMDGVAEFPVNIYAPKAGQYTLSLVSEPDEEYTVYLTQNGKAIWNLSSSEYALELSAGTNKSYGLRLVANKAPQTATGIDEAVVDAQGEIKKVIINDKVFIIRGENVYSVDGQLVK